MPKNTPISFIIMCTVLRKDETRGTYVLEIDKCFTRSGKGFPVPFKFSNSPLAIASTMRSSTNLSMAFCNIKIENEWLSKKINFNYISNVWKGFEDGLLKPSRTEVLNTQRHARCICTAREHPKKWQNYKLWLSFAFLRAFLVKCDPRKLYSIKLRPAEHFSLEFGRPINLSLRPLFWYPNSFNKIGL